MPAIIYLAATLPHGEIKAYKANSSQVHLNIYNLRTKYYE